MTSKSWLSVSAICISLSLNGLSERGAALAAGPDVIVGEVRGNGNTSSSQPINWGFANGYAGYSVGTTSCNVGTQPLSWVEGNNQHPVIGQSLYRYSVVNGASRIEQIGQAWLKHGFCALQGTICSSCSPVCGGCCSQLGVGCSDPYNAVRNGGDTTPGFRFMGAKAPVNPATGVNDYGASGSSFPNATAPADDETTGRLRALQSDVNPNSNPGALYYVEGQYVAQDDAAAGNKNNNASYRRCVFDVNHNMTWASTANGQTARGVQAIKTWGVNDNTVAYTDVDVAGDGRFTLGYDVTDLSGVGNGPWHYEYAVHNLNSDRAASSFVVPVTAATSVTNSGFRDVDYYKDGFNYGTAYDGTNWPVTIAGGSVAWNMVTASPSQNSNALRWGTTYNFRFDANSPPVLGQITLGLFKAGSPASMSVAALVPTPIVPCFCRGDLDFNSTIDGADIARFTAMYLNLEPVLPCAHIITSEGDALDQSDIDGFVDMLVNGPNVCP